ncbi:MAG: homoserine dehydrogenase [Candidatus Altiarchaeota archaeon]
MREARIVIIGFGLIGRGTARTLAEKRDYIRKKLGTDLKVVGICEHNGSVWDDRGISLKSALSKPLNRMSGWRKEKALDLLSPGSADIVLELTPGNIKTGEPGLSHMKAALRNGINVVTSNKSPLALKYNELMGLAEKHRVSLKYEATVGGAIPIINTYLNSLQINEVESAYGILNGTTNFILSKMFDEGVEFDSALKEAQELGYAEPDPTYDITGVDTAAKVVILANTFMERAVSYKDLKVEGITDVTQEALELARKHNYAIKLIGDVSQLEVSPRLVPISHPLNVSGSLNAIMLKTDVAGEITLIGKGAGPRETSSAVLGDVLEIVSKIQHGR